MHTGPDARRRAGLNVRRLRQDRGWTHAELSKKLDDHGWPIERSKLSRIETGDRGLDVNDLLALAAVFETSTDNLLTDPTIAMRAELLEAFNNWRNGYFKRVGAQVQLVVARTEENKAATELREAATDPEARQLVEEWIVKLADEGERHLAVLADQELWTETEQQRVLAEATEERGQRRPAAQARRD